MSKQNAVDLARTARSEAKRIAKGDKRTIASLIANWNECVTQAGFMYIYDFPVTGYTRKSQIVADLLRCAEQLDAYVEPVEIKTVEQYTRELNAVCSRVLVAEEAHAEALVTNEVFQRTAIQRVDGRSVQIGQIIKDAQGRSFEVTNVMRMAGYTDASGHAIGTAFPVTYGYRSIRFNTSGHNRFEYGQRTTQLVKPAPHEMEAAHTEALEMNKLHGTLHRYAVLVASDEVRNSLIEHAHTEALAINDFIDNLENACTDTEKQDAVKWLLKRVGIKEAKDACEFRGIKSAYYMRPIEEAHTQALAIEMTMIPVRSQSWWLSQSDEWKSRSLERLHAQALELSTQLNDANALSIMYGTAS